MKGIDGATVLAPSRQGAPSADPSGASGSVTCDLPARYEAVRNAREFTRVTLRHWGLGEQIDDVGLVVSELVTNALRHGLGDGPEPLPEPAVRLHLMRWTSRLVCAVRDPSAKAPVAKAPALSAEGAAGAEERLGSFGGLGSLVDLDTADGAEFDEDIFGTVSDQESGRGLFLVESFSDSWGWQPVADGQRGKVVWALFRLPPRAPGGAVAHR